MSSSTMRTPSPRHDRLVGRARQPASASRLLARQRGPEPAARVAQSCRRAPHRPDAGLSARSGVQRVRIRREEDQARQRLAELTGISSSVCSAFLGRAPGGRRRWRSLRPAIADSRRHWRRRARSRSPRSRRRGSPRPATGAFADRRRLRRCAEVRCCRWRISAHRPAARLGSRRHRLGWRTLERTLGDEPV